MPFALACELLCALSVGMPVASTDAASNTRIELTTTESQLVPSDRQRQQAILTRLRIQTALKESRQYIANRQFQEAINELEPLIASADGNDDFLELLANAYKGQIAYLMKVSKRNEAKHIRDRLNILAAGDAQSLEEIASNAARQLESVTEEVIAEPVSAVAVIAEPIKEPVASPQPEKIDSTPSADPISKTRDLLSMVSGVFSSDRSASEKADVKPRQVPVSEADPISSPERIPIAQAVQESQPIAVVASRSNTPANIEQTPDSTQPSKGASTTYEVRGKQDSLIQPGSPGTTEPFAKAEALYSQKKYAEALPYYEIAYERAEVPTSNPRWGYCLLVVSYDAYNELIQQPDHHVVPETEWANLIADLRLATNMAPSLKSYTDEALRNIELEKQRRAQLSATSTVGDIANDTPVSTSRPVTEAKPANNTVAHQSVQFQHTGQRGNWYVTETQNFVIHHRNQSTAERMATLLEQARTFAFQKWFPGEVSQTWQPRCEVFLYPTSAEYNQGTGEPAESPGHTKVMNDRGRITSRTLNLRMDFQNMDSTVLPHEVTHVVLAGQFGHHAIPRWADEGIAILTEPRAMQEAHLANLAQCHQSGRQFRCHDVLTMSQYPPGNRMRDFYAHSAGICRYLVEKGGTQKLIQFLRTALQYNGNYELALQQVYGLQGTNELEGAFGNYVAALQSGSGTRMATAIR